jgi:hypothetical protein
MHICFSQRPGELSWCSEGLELEVGFDFQQRFYSGQTGLGAHPASFPMDAGWYFVVGERNPTVKLITYSV